MQHNTKQLNMQHNNTNQYTTLRKVYAWVGLITLLMLFAFVVYFLATYDFCPLFYNAECFSF